MPRDVAACAGLEQRYEIATRPGDFRSGDVEVGWDAGIRTPIRRSRVCSLTVRRRPRSGGCVPFQATKSILQPPRYDCVIERAEEAFPETFGQFSHLRHRLNRRRKPVDFDPSKPRLFKIKRQQWWRDRPRMRGVQIE